VIDLHNHILPGLDDGPATMEDALELGRVAVAAGTRTIVATPHIDYSFRVDPAAVSSALGALRERLSAAGLPLTVLAGGEVAMTRLVDLSHGDLDAVRLGGGPFMLLESPHTTSMLDFDAQVLRLLMDGEKIVLAHPERCPLFQRSPERLARLVDAGVLSSITAGSLGDRFGRTTRRFALRLLEDGLVHNVASDAHDTRRRPPGIRAGLAHAVQELPGLAGQIDWLTREVPEAVLAGAPLPPRPAPVGRMRRRLFRRR